MEADARGGLEAIGFSLVSGEILLKSRYADPENFAPESVCAPLEGAAILNSPSLAFDLPPSNSESLAKGQRR